MNDTQHIDTIVFDLGGVLIDWNPRIYTAKFSTTKWKWNDF